jgi:hypothetical protein
MGISGCLVFAPLCRKKLVVGSCGWRTIYTMETEHWRRRSTMSFLDLLRKGFGFVLMSMGVSSPVQKKPAPKPAPKPDSDAGPGT